VLVGGEVVADAGRIHRSPEKRRVGYVPQEGALYPHLSVGQNVGFGLPRAERRRSPRIDEVLELVGLSAAYAGRRAHELSGGEQRRAALARALAPHPRLVLLDEPFSGLDAARRVETREAVLRALGAAGTTAVLVTHDQAEALSMGREVAVLRDGCIVQTAAPAILYRRPVDLEVARFVGEAVVLPGQAGAGRVRCALGDLPLDDHGGRGAVMVVIRPEQVQLRRTETSPVAAGTTGPIIRGKVVDRTYNGPDTVIRVLLEGADGCAVAARTFDHYVPDVGDVVELAVEGSVVAFPHIGDH
jgi:iron(III) transport system ATP-binding protein